MGNAWLCAQSCVRPTGKISQKSDYYQIYITYFTVQRGTCIMCTELCAFDWQNFSKYVRYQICYVK